MLLISKQYSADGRKLFPSIVYTQIASNEFLANKVNARITNGRWPLKIESNNNVVVLVSMLFRLGFWLFIRNPEDSNSDKQHRGVKVIIVGGMVIKVGHQLFKKKVYSRSIYSSPLDMRFVF